jgi:hypothetical protein
MGVFEVTTLPRQANHGLKVQLAFTMRWFVELMLKVCSTGVESAVF